MILTRKTEFPAWQKTFLFFGNHQNLDIKIDLIQVKTDQNLGQDRLMLFPSYKTPPPPSQILGYAPALAPP